MVGALSRVLGDPNCVSCGGRLEGPALDALLTGRRNACSSFGANSFDSALCVFMVVFLSSCQAASSRPLSKAEKGRGRSFEAVEEEGGGTGDRGSSIASREA